MAQVLKEESREKIIGAAEKEFLESGFEGASMRRIARDSHMTVGNVYRYFRSKEDILSVIVSPAYRAVNKLIRELTDDAVSFDKDNVSIQADKEEIGAVLDKLSEGLIDIYSKHKTAFRIMMMNSRLNDEITNWFAGVIGGVIAEIYKLPPDSRNLWALSRGYAVAVFTGIREMLDIADADTDSLKALTKIFLNSFRMMLDFDAGKYIR